MTSPQLPSDRNSASTGTNASSIYDALAAHQTGETWELQAVSVELHRWIGIFNREFKLHIPELVLCVDWLPARVLGHFRPGTNGLGLRCEIAINRRYLAQRHAAQFWDVLGTLLHEMLHAHQAVCGTPSRGNYHNREFRDKARECGLLVDTHGRQQYMPKSPFFALLAKHSIVFPDVPAPQVRIPGKSKLKLWTCPCGIRVRVAVSRFRAKCLHCGREFRRVESTTPSTVQD